MKLQNARIRNFKLLRSIDLHFSTDPRVPLTVIRAENGSGKTSTLQALRWALYGSKGLEEPTVRLAPADWPESDPCKISVEIDFSHTLVSAVGDRTLTKETQYMLKREVIERPSGDQPNREQERISLYEKTESGSDPIQGPETRLSRMLPIEMLDIFFTDGDSALTFISAQLGETTKRDQVKESIRSLLGLGLLENLDKRVKSGRSAVNRRLSRQASSNKLAQVSTELQDATDEKTDAAESVAGLHRQIENLNRKLAKVKLELQRALEAGSYEQLAHQRETFATQLQAAKDVEQQLKKRHQKLFEHELLSWNMLDPLFGKGFQLLHELKAQGVIPKTAVPVLQERLSLEKCICGEELTEGSKARQSVMKLVEQQRENDAITEQLSSLYYQAKGALDTWNTNEKDWPELMDELQHDRVAADKQIEVANGELRSVEAKLDEINQEEIESKRQLEKFLQSSIREKNRQLDRREANLHTLEEKIKSLTRQQTELRRADQKVAGLNAELSVLQDLDKIIGGALSDMQETYLNRVSHRMNELFLDMIGADPAQDAIFQGARITPEYSIVVDTKDKRTLNPDHEVNGASQRALTFSFIWALTEVSGVIAPRVIDTPLGMMSGNVKRRVLTTVAAPADEQEIDRQIVLFLTQSEIANTEDILDDRVGTIVTLTKTDDYPADLVNDPRAEQPEIRFCACNHRHYCEACQRKSSDDFHLAYRAS